MTVQELSPNNAMIAGSDFWVLPEEENCDWFQKMDWYSNFQFSKTKFKKLKSIDQKILNISAEEDFDIKDIRCQADSPIMLVGSEYFPCTYVVLLPYKDFASWLLQIKEIAKGLQTIKLRIFLPKPITRDDFYAVHSQFFSEEDELTLVV